MAAPLYVTVHLPLAVLSRAVNAAFADWEAAERRAEEQGAKVRARLLRQGPIRLHFLQGRLESRLDLAVDARILPLEAGRWGAVPGLSPRQADFEISVHFSTQLRLGPQWELRSETSARSQWQRRPALGIGWLKVPLTALVTPFLEQEVAAAAQEVDRAIAQAVDLPAIMAEAWMTLSQAIPLHAGEPAWLHLHPQPLPVAVTPLTGDTDGLALRLALNLDPAMYWGEAPPPPSPLALPPPQDAPSLPATSALPWRLHIARAQLTALLQQPVSGDGRWWQRLETGRPVWLADAAALDFRLPYVLWLGRRLGRRRLQGIVRVRTRLQPGPEAETLHLTDWTLRLTQGDPLSRFLFGLGRRRLSRLIHQEANRVLQRELSQFLAGIRQEITALVPQPGLRLRGDLTQITVEHLAPSPGGLQVNGQGTGTVDLLIEVL